MEGIAVLNIPSMHGGSNLWGETESTEKLKKCQEVTVDPDALEMCSQGKHRLLTIKKELTNNSKARCLLKRVSFPLSCYAYICGSKINVPM